MDLSKALTGVTSDGVVLSDKGSAFTVRINLDPDGRIAEIAFKGREGFTLRDQIRELKGMPVSQAVKVAAGFRFGDDHPNEAYYRRLVSDPDQDRATLMVAAWARSTSRPGGASGAIADLWGVSRRTAFRRLARARATTAASAGPDRGGHR